MRRPRVVLCALVVALGLNAKAEPLRPATAPAVRPDPWQPPPPQPTFRPSWDLDGTYVWLGPLAAATWSASMDSRSDRAAWDSAFGAELSIVRVRERQPVGELGGSVGATRSTQRGGRVWADAILGTAVRGLRIGASAGPFIQFSDESRPQLGASIRIWGYAGIAPYARLGFAESASFVELGVHIPLPVFRR